MFISRPVIAPAVAQPPKPAMRYALPGERPPSMRPPGQRDDIIERLDAYAERVRKR